MNTTTTNSYHPSSFSTNNAQDNISLIDTTALSELLQGATKALEGLLYKV